MTRRSSLNREGDVRMQVTNCLCPVDPRIVGSREENGDRILMYECPNCRKQQEIKIPAEENE